MEKYQFKTNINCGGCIAKVTPALNGNVHIKEWNADTTNPDKILTITTDTLSWQEVITLLDEAGFKATPLN